MRSRNPVVRGPSAHSGPGETRCPIPRTILSPAFRTATDWSQARESATWTTRDPTRF